MKTLLIFDEAIDLSKLKLNAYLSTSEDIDIFPLTSQWQVIRKVEETCESMASAETELVGSAALIDKEVDALRARISKWSAELGSYKINGKPLKEWFLLSNGEVSTWWFSSLSEKNTLTTDAFFRMAQLMAIEKNIAVGSYEACVFSISDSHFSLALDALCKRYSVSVSPISSRISVEKRLKSYLRQKSVFSLMLRAVAGLAVYVFRAIRARFVMGAIKNRIDRLENPILFVSYFPSVDKKLAEEGVLKNKYAASLQHKLSDMKKKVVWIWMYVFLDGHSYGSALKLAKRFARNGETNFFINEFMSFGTLLRVLTLWFQQIRIFSRLKKLMPDQALYEDLTLPEGAIFIRDLMAESFIGWPGLFGILHFELYKNIFSCFSDVPQCIYYSEMHTWEKALNSAKQSKAPRMKTIGFQHAGFSINHFFYFHHPSEIEAQEDSAVSLPLPDILACNGDIPLSLIADCRYPNVRKVEAIRHMYLLGRINSADTPVVRKKIVLIAGSVKKEETRALLSLFYEAFPAPKGFEVWLKGHPSLPLDSILEELKINITDCGYLIKDNDIEELLKSAGILVVGDSTVALEALAANCKVIVPVFSETMFLNPLKGFEEHYLKVSDPAGLKKGITGFMENNMKADNNDGKDFVSRYWCLDKSLRRWEELLNEVMI